MSYDLEIWSAREPEFPAALPSPERWVRQNGTWAYPGKGWQIVLDDPVGVDAEDVPERIGGLLAGIAYLTRISAEPAHAPKAAHQLLMRTARSLAKAAHGVLHDPQEDSFQLGSGVKRFVPPGKEQQDRTLALSWWFGPDALATKAGFETLVGLLRKHMPEALPRRYGTYEPPEHRLSERGDAHLVEFLATEGRRFMPVLFPHRPVTGFGMHLPEPFGQSQDRHGFRANTISIEILAATLQQPGWERQVRGLWRRMSEFLQPFYGDVRFVSDSQPHPVRAWYWRGMPRTPGVAAVIGRAYQELWPPFAEARQPGGSLAYFEAEAWGEPGDIFAGAGGLPADLVNPNANYWGIEKYPVLWPFDLPNDA